MAKALKITTASEHTESANKLLNGTATEPKKGKRGPAKEAKETIHATVVCYKEDIDFIKDYAYTNRIPVKLALADIVGKFKASYKGELISESTKRK